MSLFNDTAICNDKIYPLIDENVEILNHVYFFLNLGACPHCETNMKWAIDGIRQYKNVEVCIFIAGVSAKSVQEIQKTNKWDDYYVMPELKGAISKIYDVKMANSAIILDKDGKNLKTFNEAEYVDLID